MSASLAAIQAVSRDLGLTSTQAHLLILSSSGRFTANELCDAAGVSYDTLRVMMTRMRERLAKGNVYKVGIYDVTPDLRERVNALVETENGSLLWTTPSKPELNENIVLAPPGCQADKGADGQSAPTLRPPLHQRPVEEAR